MAYVAYVDTSAFLKLYVEEAETEALWAWLHEHRPALVSSDLLRVEARRAVRLLPPEAQVEVRAALDDVASVPVTLGVCDRASELPPAVLRSLDAIHVASALQLGDELDVIVTYDARMADAARSVGLAVESPGAS